MLSINTELSNGDNYGFLPDNIHIVANREWAEANPAAARLFAVMQLPIEDVNAQNLRMQDGETSEAAIERHVDGWIKAHQILFKSWIKTATEATYQKKTTG